MTDHAPVPGGQLAYTVRGEGPPILLLRPLGGSMLSWDRFADALAERTRVIAFDPRGVGEPTPAPLTVTTRDMARDAVALLDHLTIARTHVYGISLGGMVASWLAVNAPARVDRLILASTMPHGTEIRLAALWRGFSLARCLARPARETEAALAKRILSPHFRSRHPDDVLRIQELARERPATHRALLTLLGAAARHDVRSRLHDIHAKTLVLVGEHDPLLTLQSVKELLTVSAATYDVIPDAGHDISAEAPRATAERVLAHIHENTRDND